MNVRVRWTYTYMTEETFDAIVNVPDEGVTLSWDDARQMAIDAAIGVPNGDLKAVATEYPGQPFEQVELVEPAPADADVQILAVPGGDPEVVTLVVL